MPDEYAMEIVRESEEIQMNSYNYSTIVRIRKGEARALKAGGMWIYDNEIDRIDGTFENGDLVTVLDFDDYFLG